MIKFSLFQKLGKVMILLVIVMALLIIAGLTTSSRAGAKGAASCFGTYLIEFDNQSEGTWTLSIDGTAHATDSAEQVFGFSHLQGSWKSSGKTAMVTLLNFTIDPNSVEPAGYARVDAEVTFGNGCESITGVYDLWLYGSAEDPLDRTTGGFQGGDDLVLSGRRINP
jgi:hypothetical protein